MTRAESNIVLFSITLCWASSYIFVKNLPPDLSPFAYMTMTSGLAFIILSTVFFRRLPGLKGRVLLRSAVLAAIICCNLVFERLGIAQIPASTASFVASLTIVFVPVFLLFLKKKPTKAPMNTGLCGRSLSLCSNTAGFLCRGGRISHHRTSLQRPANPVLCSGL